ncbi:Uroporphyrinogen decarboxylase 1 [Hibiscus syriacus]|uniref:Uroporphyrinogen decarboxylase 1 n=1 Tax=Hibiscus syriacus TaxID=106335 RepID=A0A6A2YP78_HIBSY|nr:Uroporphyrinogen decarboxylase 1 [Hibiscus syriacus]
MLSTYALCLHFICVLDPLLVKAVRGDPVSRPPAWMMRLAGRYMVVYRKLAEKHPSFRERSETTDLIVEISLQPWEAFRPDGVIIFSDILTPLPAFGVPFDIEEVGDHAVVLGFAGAPWTIATYRGRVVKCAGPRGHILNLGHGVLVGIPEEAVAHFFGVTKSLKYDSSSQNQATEESKFISLRTLENFAMN